jgi:hypothetical protein
LANNPQHPPPPFGLIYEGAIDRRHLFVTPCSSPKTHVTHTLSHNVDSCNLYPSLRLLYPISFPETPVSYILSWDSCILYPSLRLLYPISFSETPVSYILPETPVSYILPWDSCILYPSLKLLHPITFPDTPVSYILPWDSFITVCSIYPIPCDYMLYSLFCILS